MCRGPCALTSTGATSIHLPPLTATGTPSLPFRITNSEVTAEMRWRTNASSASPATHCREVGMKAGYGSGTLW